jgi:hypothetical protein
MSLATLQVFQVPFLKLSSVTYTLTPHPASVATLQVSHAHSHISGHPSSISGTILEAFKCSLHIHATSNICGNPSSVPGTIPQARKHFLHSRATSVSLATLQVSQVQSLKVSCISCTINHTFHVSSPTVLKGRISVSLALCLTHTSQRHYMGSLYLLHCQPAVCCCASACTNLVPLYTAVSRARLLEALRSLQFVLSILHSRRLSRGILPRGLAELLVRLQHLKCGVPGSS